MGLVLSIEWGCKGEGEMKFGEKIPSQQWSRARGQNKE
jgi:hypothetical protein